MKRKNLLLLTLLLIACGIWVTDLWAQHRELSEANKLESAELQPAKMPLVMRTSIEYKAEGLRDPFQGSQDKAGTGGEGALSAPPTLNIQGIVWGGRLPQAIINNKVIKIGDTLEGAKIIDINKEGVTFFFAGAQYTVNSPAGAELEKLKPKAQPAKEEAGGGKKP